jgi:transposase
MLVGMRTPIFVRPLTDAEQQALSAGLRSPDAFVLRRCQILLASARGERAPRIAQQLGCDDQTVLDALHAFNAQGLPALQKGSSRPHRPPPRAFSDDRAEQLRALLHRRPRDFGHPTSLWTLDLAAEVSFAQGLTPRLVTGESIRTTLLRLGIGWKRAKHWITSPDPAYARKKGAATA